MFILTDGKNYVMENPMKTGEFLRTTYSVEAKEFTYKQAKNLLTRNKSKKLSWIKGFQMVNKENGKVEEVTSKYSNSGVYCGDRGINFDDSILAEINKGVDAISKVDILNNDQLNKYNSSLEQALSFYDSAISDIRHARMDKHPPAHVMTKIDKISNNLEEKRRDIKQAKRYVEVMINGSTNQWGIKKMKIELDNARNKPYKGRTEYYSMVEDLLEGY